MVTILRHGDTFVTKDPSTQEWTEMINVVFIEKGRDGVNKTLSESSKALADVLGLQNVGLDNTRTHTQPVRSDQIAQFPLGTELALHINREMWSIPQMANQEDKAPRVIDGKITYFKTSLSKIQEEDKDYRTVNVNIEAMVPQELLNQATRTLRATEVRTVHRASVPVPQQTTQ